MNLWKILTLPCEEASRLASDELDQPLTGVERFALRAHLVSCKSCRRFRRQVSLIESAQEELTAEARDRIKKNLL